MIGALLLNLENQYRNILHSLFFHKITRKTSHHPDLPEYVILKIYTVRKCILIRKQGFYEVLIFYFPGLATINPHNK